MAVAACVNASVSRLLGGETGWRELGGSPEEAAVGGYARHAALAHAVSFVASVAASKSVTADRAARAAAVDVCEHAVTVLLESLGNEKGKSSSGMQHAALGDQGSGTARLMFLLIAAARLPVDVAALHGPVGGARCYLDRQGRLPAWVFAAQDRCLERVLGYMSPTGQQELLHMAGPAGARLLATTPGIGPGTKPSMPSRLGPRSVSSGSGGISGS